VPGRLSRAVSRLHWVRKISILICVSVFLFCADTAQVAAKKPQPIPPENIRPPQGMELPPSGTAGSPAPVLPPAPKTQPVENATEEDAAQEPAVQQTASKTPAQTPAAIAEDTRDSKDKRDDIIIEKNIFSPERKKWVSEPASNKQAADKQVKKEINELMLLGTVIGGDRRYAVLRIKKDEGKGGFKPYMRGDYIQGYLVKEIDEKKVVLQDDAENAEYVLYINDDKKERIAEKTAIKAEPPKAAAAVEEKKEDRFARKRKARRARQAPPPSEPPDAAKQPGPPADAPDTAKQPPEPQGEAQEE
jgi:hypothetical protein